VGREYGFGAHPENSSLILNSERKWYKFKPQIIEMLNNEVRLNRIIKELGIPEGLFTVIKEMVNREP
jgi:hypothetical protein